ncbi:hypothetical protein [Saccharopolyspora phatthalungensis]|uniref:Uncharacterized protein n=1 Tax=Saccharopolyspora phatthalungensis TaxID=664693 RepID=A0A840QCR3_9PSEU|nr:hypothetical protein [Saccharopolyspora phatthalungensis]MBB5156408.1 hypothetical protein [Saccharopolyspora phatthalungensis]
MPQALLILAVLAWSLIFGRAILLWWLPGHRPIFAQARRARATVARGGTAGPVA